MVLKHIVRNNKGFTIISSLIAFGLFGLVTLLVVNLVRSNSQVRLRFDIYQTAFAIRSNIIASLRDNKSFEKTLADPASTSLKCFQDKEVCCYDSIETNPLGICQNPHGGGLNILRADYGSTYTAPNEDPGEKTVYLNYLSESPSADGTLASSPNTQGYDLMGKKCNTFNVQNGHDTCVFQYQITWRAICRMPCSPNTVQLEVRGKLLFRPSSKLGSLSLDADKLDFYLVRDAVTKSSESKGNMVVFDEPGTFLFEVPPQVTTLLVEAWGAGGGGAGAVTLSTSPGNGRPDEKWQLAGGAGGGGGYAKRTMPVEQGQQIQLVVGRGGQGIISAVQINSTQFANFGGQDGGDSIVRNLSNPIGSFTATGGDRGRACFDWPCSNDNTYGNTGKGGDGGRGIGGMINLEGRKGGNFHDVFDEDYDPGVRIPVEVGGQDEIKMISIYPKPDGDNSEGGLKVTTWNGSSMYSAGRYIAYDSSSTNTRNQIDKELTWMGKSNSGSDACKIVIDGQTKSKRGPNLDGDNNYPCENGSNNDISIYGDWTVGFKVSFTGQLAKTNIDSISPEFSSYYKDYSSGKADNISIRNIAWYGGATIAIVEASETSFALPAYVKYISLGEVKNSLGVTQSQFNANKFKVLARSGNKFVVSKYDGTPFWTMLASNDSSQKTFEKFAKSTKKIELDQCQVGLNKKTKATYFDSWVFDLNKKIKASKSNPRAKAMDSKVGSNDYFYKWLKEINTKKPEIKKVGARSRSLPAFDIFLNLIGPQNCFAGGGNCPTPPNYTNCANHEFNCDSKAECAACPTTVSGMTATSCNLVMCQGSNPPDTLASICQPCGTLTTASQCTSNYDCSTKTVCGSCPVGGPQVSTDCNIFACQTDSKCAACPVGGAQVLSDCSKFACQGDPKCASCPANPTEADCTSILACESNPRCASTCTDPTPEQCSGANSIYSCASNPRCLSCPLTPTADDCTGPSSVYDCSTSPACGNCPAEPTQENCDTLATCSLNPICGDCPAFPSSNECSSIYKCSTAELCGPCPNGVGEPTATQCTTYPLCSLEPACCPSGAGEPTTTQCSTIPACSTVPACCPSGTGEPTATQCSTLPACSTAPACGDCANGPANLAECTSVYACQNHPNCQSCPTSPVPTADQCNQVLDCAGKYQCSECPTDINTITATDCSSISECQTATICQICPSTPTDMTDPLCAQYRDCKIKAQCSQPPVGIYFDCNGFGCNKLQTGSGSNIMGYFRFVKVTMTTLQNGIPPEIRYRYDAASPGRGVIKIFYGGIGGGGGGGGGAGGANDYLNEGTPPGRPGGGGAGMRLDGKNSLGVRSPAMHGAHGRVVIFY